MAASVHFELALLHMIHLLVYADGVLDEKEEALLAKICQEEHIAKPVIRAFRASIMGAHEKDIYDRGMDLLERCSNSERLRVFSHLFKMAHADNDLNIREVRFMFYAMKRQDLEFADVERTSLLAS